jgi:16S rRNA (guanine(966)-N(2))-methyltransferase RsmD
LLLNKSYNARPTTDYARGSLFNILNNYFFFENVKVLDLYAGTGAIGFEFASRGAKSVEMVEIDVKNYKFITESVAQLKANEVKPFRGDALVYLNRCMPGYDIIFADPPYVMEGTEKVHEIVFERNLLNPEGWLILEHDDKRDFKIYQHFRETRVYGKVHFSIFYK